MAKKTLDRLNDLISLLVAIVLFLLGAYAVFALWDNHQVYMAAENVQKDLLEMKPEVDPETGYSDFDALHAINPDICAWLTMDNTNIDYPVVQGETALTYINTDIYGNFALAGSIFLDPENDREFQDAYSLVYGHNMANHKMFGDLALYEEQAFFDDNTTGTLLLPDRSYKLEVFACLQIRSGEEAIYEPLQWKEDITGLLTYVEAHSLHLHLEIIERLRKDENPQVLALSTCSNHFSDARTVLLARMVPDQTN